MVRLFDLLLELGQTIVVEEHAGCSVDIREGADMHVRSQQVHESAATHFLVLPCSVRTPGATLYIWQMQVHSARAK